MMSSSQENVYLKEEIKTSILHEIGHHVYETVVDDDKKDKWHLLHRKTYSPIGGGRSFVSGNPLEYFSDRYADYVLRGDYMAAEYPSEFEFMEKDVFLGRTYQGDT